MPRLSPSPCLSLPRWQSPQDQEEDTAQQGRKKKKKKKGSDDEAFEDSIDGDRGPGGGLYVRWFQVRQAGGGCETLGRPPGSAYSPSTRSLSYSSSQDELEGKPKATQQEEGPKGRG